MQIAAYKGLSFWPSKVIEWQTWSEYSHVGNYFDHDVSFECADNTKITIPAGRTIEAWSPGGVRIGLTLGELHTPGTPVDLFDFNPPLTAQEEILITKFLYSQLGCRYDYPGLLGFVLRPKTNPRKDDVWWCSEFVGESAAEAKRFFQERWPFWKLSPADVVMSPILKYNRSMVC